MKISLHQDKEGHRAPLSYYVNSLRFESLEYEHAQASSENGSSVLTQTPGSHGHLSLWEWRKRGALTCLPRRPQGTPTTC